MNTVGIERISNPRTPTLGDSKMTEAKRFYD
jgi:hypothetical protein